MQRILTRRSALVMGLAAGVSAMLPWPASAQSQAKAAGQWTLAPPMPRAMGFVDEYDIATDSWTPRTSMPTPRNHYVARAIGEKIYAANGRTDSVFVTSADVTDIVDEYNPSTDSWLNVSRAITSRGDVSGDVYNDRLYIAGGEYQDTAKKMALWEVETFDPASLAWAVLPHMNVSRHGFAAAFVGKNLHVCGGGFQSDGMPGIYSPTATHEIYEVS